MPVVRNWKKHYSERCQSARDALPKIRSGSRVFLSPGCGEPQHLLEELVELAHTSGITVVDSPADIGKAVQEIG